MANSTHFLDSSGLTYLWNKIKNLLSNHYVTFGYGTCTTAAGTADKVVTISNPRWVLKPGAIIGVKFSNSNTASDVTLNVNGTGAKSIWYNSSVYTGTNISPTGAANRVVYYMYDGTYWVYLSNGIYNSDTYNQTRLDRYQMIAGTNGLAGYNFVMMKPDGTFESFFLEYSTGTNKQVNTSGFVPGTLLINYTTTSYSAGDILATNRIWESYPTVNLEALTNAGRTLTPNKKLYIKGEIKSDGLFYLDTVWHTQTLPTSDDGKVYISAGMLYSSYQMNFESNHPMYWYKNGAVREYGDFGRKSIVGENTTGESFNSVVAGVGAERFNDYLLNIPTGVYSHAEGSGTTASGACSHAEGTSTTASYEGAHAEGINTTASHNGAHAEGVGSIASVQGAHAEGVSTTASAQSAHSEGTGTTASGYGSHAEGTATTAAGTNQHVQGTYNEVDSSGVYAHIVGNGTSSARANIHTLDWNGVAWFKGGVKVGGTNPSTATELFGIATELRINCGSLSSLPTTISDSRITSDMEFSGYYEASNGSAITSDLTVTTADGSVTISGSLSGFTTLRIGLVHVT